LKKRNSISNSPRPSSRELEISETGEATDLSHLVGGDDDEDHTGEHKSSSSSSSSSSSYSSSKYSPKASSKKVDFRGGEEDEEDDKLTTMFSASSKLQFNPDTIEFDAKTDEIPYSSGINIDKQSPGGIMSTPGKIS
jgi:hypothetical protein